MTVRTALSPVQETDDDALMARLALRDTDALRAIADRHAQLVWRIAFRMLNDAHEAEDVAQESLLRLWDKAESWQSGNSGVAAWLTRVATNLCIDKIRKNRRLTTAEDAPERADDDPLADAQIEHDEVRAAVVACIEALPERQRAAIVLTYYEEQPNQGAADMLSMQIKAFESLLFRARAALRGCVERKGVAGAST